MGRDGQTDRMEVIRNEVLVEERIVCSFNGVVHDLLRPRVGARLRSITAVLLCKLTLLAIVLIAAWLNTTHRANTAIRDPDALVNEQDILSARIANRQRPYSQRTRHA